ncbi:hypothetical protein [Chryseobacterium luteum]|uniref:Uncharacterized protein n=1 Tax=Chryseobacterium luteum TaxID=421531 RepID=A0A085ZAT3_9FLAO|nr:hypothetical protein [Chryseobacterium luteum]KFF01547.1 hypothetical protein IX38_17060 [Chryseobacterium luteum]
MMDKELRNLFEIKEDDKINVSENKQNILKHILIRLAIFIAGTIGFTAVIFSVSGWDVLGYLIIMFAFHVVWFVCILIEALILHVNGKYILRNANLIFSVVILILYCIAYIAIFNPQY